MPKETFSNFGQTTLVGAISTTPAAGTIETWTFSSTTSFPQNSGQFRLMCDNEILIGTSPPASGSTVSVSRGAENTSPTTHSNGATVLVELTAGSLNVFEQSINKNSASGYCPLDSGSLVPTANIPNLSETKITNLTTDLTARELTSHKGVASGYCPLDSGAKISTIYLPSTAPGTELAYTEQVAAQTGIPADGALHTVTGMSITFTASAKAILEARLTVSAPNGTPAGNAAIADASNVVVGNTFLQFPSGGNWVTFGIKTRLPSSLYPITPGSSYTFTVRVSTTNVGGTFSIPQSTPGVTGSDSVNWIRATAC